MNTTWYPKRRCVISQSLAEKIPGANDVAFARGFVLKRPDSGNKVCTLLPQRVLNARSAAEAAPVHPSLVLLLKPNLSNRMTTSATEAEVEPPAHRGRRETARL